MIALFTWNDSFLTHIPSVDEQHQKLVGLINNLGEMVISSDHLDQESYRKVRDGVMEYAGVHFTHEEKLMREVGLDLRHVDHHRSEHQAFVREILDLEETGDDVSAEQAKRLVEFLIYWLTYHILGVDQGMARQVQAVQAGSSHTEAFDVQTNPVGPQSEPLLAAMTGLFFMVSERNRELRALNRELEQRVRQRTKELERTNEQLQVLSTRDDLTGLPNRRYAMLSLQQLWSEKQRYGDALSVLLLDADHFKAVNDQFGHAQGDALLRTLADRLRHTVRGSDIVCRLGGDEFLVICPRSSYAGTMEVAKKILAESQPFLTSDGVECWNGSLSIGVAEADGMMEQPDNLLQAADTAMYEAKRKGGSCAA